MIKAKQLRQAYICMANLYGVIESDDAYSILKSYYPELTKKAFVTDLKEREKHWMTRFYAVIKTTKRDHFIISQELLGEEDWDRIFEEGQGKPYYVPDIETFLKYEDPGFRENEADFDRLASFLRFHAKPRSGTQKDLFILKMLLKHDLRLGYHQFIQRYLQDPYFGYEFQNEADLQRFLNLVNEVYNNTKLYENRGYSPNEMFRLSPKKDGPLQISIGPNIRKMLLDGEMDIEEYRQAIAQSSLPLETKMDLFRQLEEIKRKKGSRA